MKNAYWIVYEDGGNVFQSAERSEAVDRFEELLADDEGHGDLQLVQVEREVKAEEED